MNKKFKFEGYVTRLAEWEDANIGIFSNKKRDNQYRYLDEKPIVELVDFFQQNLLGKKVRIKVEVLKNKKKKEAKKE